MGEMDIAGVAALVAEPARGWMLLALSDGRAVSAGRLAEEGGVTPATASSHLKKLTAGGLLVVEQVGRQRFYRLSGPRVAALLEMLEVLAAPAPIHSFNQASRARAVRQARVCYDHIGGALGVAMMRSMLERGHITGAGWGPAPEEPEYALTDSGLEFLHRLGVDVPEQRRHVDYCLDWGSEHHMSGIAGRMLCDAALRIGWFERTDGSRALRWTESGRAAFAREFRYADAG